MSRAARRAELRRLEASVAQIQRTVSDLEARRDELTVRAAVLSLLERVAAEADAHLQRYGAPPLLRGPDLAAEGDGPRACTASGLPAPSALEERIDVLRPGRSLLNLEGWAQSVCWCGCPRSHACVRACTFARALSPPKYVRPRERVHEWMRAKTHVPPPLFSPG
jgi:hypothetical protein